MFVNLRDFQFQVEEFSIDYYINIYMSSRVILFIIILIYNTIVYIYIYV